MKKKAFLQPGMFLPQRQSVNADHESILVASLSKMLARAGYSVSQADVTNFYVALKSKPLAILVSPDSTGNINLVHSLAQSLVGGDFLHFQTISGHPWWAQGSEDMAISTGLHERYLTEKMLAVIEEASLPQNAQKVFIACLKQISPAEVLSFFTEVAYQLQHGEIMRIGDTHLSIPVRFPPNLYFIGTMDTQSFEWWDNDLLLNATVIQWSYTSSLERNPPEWGYPLPDGEFMRFSIRNRDLAYKKMVPILKQNRHPLLPLFQVEASLQKYTSNRLDHVVDEIMIYLSNSWSELGNGLFHLLPARNLMIALDMAIAQILLPRAVDAIRHISPLRRQLRKTLIGQFPRSAAFVAATSMAG